MRRYAVLFARSLDVFLVVKGTHSPTFVRETGQALTYHPPGGPLPVRTSCS